ncbi:DUF4390 domain-containing protein [Pseudoduganella sp. CY13W]|uniref:DUF4390 domain-containing protein n=1 Tax=Duganella qianjiadongensis TaxID=2692176 RepID=A0ABW9VGT6_9BURK|nr:DUF4390 domain-containing protein [Duganella qianjiadongensis]MYM38839.1 DUF4390 domain-containing protein [Duganella qianjiadongensis]
MRSFSSLCPHQPSTGPDVTRRVLRLLIARILLILACVLPQLARADGVEIRRFNIEASEEGYRLNARYGFELSPDMEDTLQHGVSLYFTTEVEFTRPRWYWFDEKAIVARQTIVLGYNVLTRKYSVNVNGSLKQNYSSSLEDALLSIRNPNRWVVAPRSSLKVGENYNVKLSMGLDTNYISKPLKVNALNNSEWRLTSDKKIFQYKAE